MKIDVTAAELEWLIEWLEEINIHRESDLSEFEEHIRENGSDAEFWLAARRDALDELEQVRAIGRKLLDVQEEVVEDGYHER